MSRGFVKEGDQEEVPILLPRAFLPSGTPNYVTPEGLKLLQDEMESLRKEWIEAGSSYVTKNYIDAKMSQLSGRINSAVLIDPTKSNPETVSFGMYVKYNNKVIRIVGVDEADASKGLISFVSPIAKALIGKKKGDKFEIKVPRGTEIIEIQEVMTFAFCDQGTLGREQKVNIKKSNTKKNRDISEINYDQKEVADDSSKTDKTRSLELKTQNSTNIVMENNPTDFLPLVNERGNIVGRALYLEIHNGNKLLHPAVHLIVYNSKKELVTEYSWHVAFGETAEKTLKRKLKELQIQGIKTKFDKQYIREDKNEKELISVFTAILSY